MPAAPGGGRGENSPSPSKGLQHWWSFCGLGRINYGDLQPVLFTRGWAWAQGIGPGDYGILPPWPGPGLALKKELAEEMPALCGHDPAKEKLILTHAPAYGRETRNLAERAHLADPGAGGVHQCISGSPLRWPGRGGVCGRPSGTVPAGSPGAILAHCLPWRRGVPEGVLPPWSLQGGAACRSSAGGAPRAAALALSL
ncbi:MAG: hypothetical protein ACLS43_09420 [Evtepia gabavorous]